MLKAKLALITCYVKHMKLWLVNYYMNIYSAVWILV